MKPVIRIMSITGVLVCASVLASAAEVKGVLMDKMCSGTAATKGQSFAASHDTKCALEPPCAGSGFVVFTPDGKVITLDAAGNTKAMAALKATKKTDHLNVTVSGDVTGSTMKVSSLALD